MNNRVLQEMFDDRAALGCRRLLLHARRSARRCSPSRRRKTDIGRSERMLAETHQGQDQQPRGLRPARTPGPGPRRPYKDIVHVRRPSPRSTAAHGRPLRPARTTRPHDQNARSHERGIRDEAERGRHGAARRAASRPAGDRAGHRPQPGRRPADAGRHGPPATRSASSTAATERVSVRAGRLTGRSTPGPRAAPRRATWSRSMPGAIRRFEDAGGELVVGPTDDPLLGVTCALIRLPEGVDVELVAPLPGRRVADHRPARPGWRAGPSVLLGRGPRRLDRPRARARRGPAGAADLRGHLRLDDRLRAAPQRAGRRADGREALTTPPPAQPALAST